MSRNRYQDQRNAPTPATLIKYIPGEAAMNRHARRLSLNLSGEQAMRDWAIEKELALRIQNKGHHWLFERQGFIAEWWPSSAKLVIGRRYQSGVHVHDYLQAQKIIEAAMRKSKPVT